MKKKIVLSACAAILSCAITIGTGAKTANADELVWGTFIKPDNLVSESVSFSQPFGYQWDSLKYSGVSGDGNRFEVCVMNDNRLDLGVSSGYNIGNVPFAQIEDSERINSFMVSSTFSASYIDDSEESKEAPLINSNMDNLMFVNFGYAFAVNDVFDTPSTVNIFFRDVKYLNTASIDIIYRDERYRLMSDDVNGLAEDFERTGTIKFEFAQVRLDYYGMDKYLYSFAFKTDNHCVSYGNLSTTYSLSGNEKLFKCENSGSVEGDETRSVVSLFGFLDKYPIFGCSSSIGSFDDSVALICTGNYSKSEKLSELNYGDFVTNVFSLKKYDDVAETYTQMYNSEHGITDGGNDNPKQDGNHKQDFSSIDSTAKRVLAVALVVTAAVGVFTVTSTVIRGRKRRKGVRRK